MYHYYMFNKPVGCVTARSDERYPTVMDYFKELHNENLSPVGRLDLETEGLLIITDDGAWNQLMTRPEHKKEKCYEFFVLGDNRNNSEDSRFSTVGNVVKNDIVGMAWIRLKPFSLINKSNKDYVRPTPTPPGYVPEPAK